MKSPIAEASEYLDSIIKERKSRDTGLHATDVRIVTEIAVILTKLGAYRKLVATESLNLAKLIQANNGIVDSVSELQEGLEVELIGAARRVNPETLYPIREKAPPRLEVAPTKPV